MGAFIEEMTAAGILIATGGLEPGGVKVTSVGDEITVTDGPVRRGQGGDPRLRPGRGRLPRGGARGRAAASAGSSVTATASCTGSSVRDRPRVRAGLHARVDAVWKLESARIVAALARMVHDVGLAEELAQDALVAALEQWPDEGVPDNPGAWLTTVAKRRAVDHLRREGRAGACPRGAGARRPSPRRRTDGSGDDDADVLRLMFLSCHPVLRTEGRVALTLRLLGGLSAAEIARAFLVAHADRSAADRRREAHPRRGRGRVRDAGARRARRAPVVRARGRLPRVQRGLRGDLRARTCCARTCAGQALRLGHRLAALAPAEPEVHGLVALMELQASRAGGAHRPGGRADPAARAGPRALGSGARAPRASPSMLRGPRPRREPRDRTSCRPRSRSATRRPGAPRTPTGRRSPRSTTGSPRSCPTPVVALNRAVAVGRARGPEAGLALVDAAARRPPPARLPPAARASAPTCWAAWDAARRRAGSTPARPP